MKTLHPFQSQGVSFLKERKTALLFDEPGLGKTFQAISAWPRSGDHRAVVVCPKSVKSVWEREIRDTRPDLTVAVLSGRTAWRWPRLGEVVVLNYDILPRDSGLDTLPGAPVSMTGDEAHMVKSSTAQRSLAFRRLGAQILFRKGSVHVLTGTPLFSWPSDLWGLTFSSHLSGPLWGTYKRFVYLFRGYPTDFGMRWGQPRPEVAEIMRPWCLGRKKSEVLSELPPKTYQRIDIASKRVKEEVSDEELAASASRDVPSPNLSKARAELALAKAKSTEFRELVQTLCREGPLLVFSAHVNASRIAADILGVESYDGQTSDVDRARIEQAFQEGKVQAMVGTIGAMGVGLTLTRASTVVFLERAWTVSENVQAEDRVHRLTQTRGVRIIDIVAENSKLDAAVFAILRRKAKILDASVEAARG